MSGPNDYHELPHWRACVTAFVEAGFSPGDVVRHAWFYQHLHLSMPTDRTPFGQAKESRLQYLSDMERVKEALLEEHRIAIRAKPGVGYEVVAPGDQSSWAYKQEVRDIQKSIHRGLQRITHVKTEELSLAEAKERSDLLAKHAMLASMATRARRLKP